MHSLDKKEDKDEVNAEAEAEELEREDEYILAGQRRLIKDGDGKGMGHGSRMLRSSAAKVTR